MSEARDPETAEAIIAEAGAPEVAARLSAQEAEMQAAVASVVPLVQCPPLVYPVPSDDTSRAREVVDAEETNDVERPAPLLDEGGSALVRVRPEPRGWDHPRVLWRSRDDPEGEPLLALEDAAEGGRWNTFEQYRQLAERSLRTALSVVADELPGVAQVRAFLSRATFTFLTLLRPMTLALLPQELETRSLGKSVFLRRERGVWDQLHRQKGLLANANELLSARSAEVEDLRLCCADAKVEAAAV